MAIISSAFGEKRSSLANPDKYILSFFDQGVTTASGKKVNEITALNISAVWNATLKISNAVAMLPLIFYKRINDREKEHAYDHNLYNILHLKTNKELSSFYWRQTSMGHLLLWGNCYSQIIRDNGGKIISLWLLQPDKMEVKRINGDLWYFYTKSDSDVVPLRYDEVFHIAGFGFDGLKGYPIINKAKETLGLSLASEEYGNRLFSNGARPGGVLEHPGTLGEEAQKRLIKSWEKRHKSVEMSHNVAVLEEGMKFHEIAFNPQQAQLLETRRFTIDEIARWFNIPAHMINSLERSTNNNISTQGLEFVKYTMMPYYVLWEQSIGLRLLDDNEQKKNFAEFNVNALERGDYLTRWRGYQIGLNNGVYSINDVLALENQNPFPGGEAHHIQINMGTISPEGDIVNPQAQEGDKNKPKPKEDDDNAVQQGKGQGRGQEEVESDRQIRISAIRRLLKDAIFRALWRERQNILPQAEKFLANEDTEGFSIWLEEFYRDNQTYFERQVMPVFLALAEMAQFDVAKRNGGQAGMTPEYELVVRQHVSAFATAYAQQNKLEVNEAAKNGVEAVRQLLDEWNKTKPEQVAEQEVRIANDEFERAALETMTIAI